MSFLKSRPSHFRFAKLTWEFGCCPPIKGKDFGLYFPSHHQAFFTDPKDVCPAAPPSFHHGVSPTNGSRFSDDLKCCSATPGIMRGTISQCNPSQDYWTCRLRIVDWSCRLHFIRVPYDFTSHRGLCSAAIIYSRHRSMTTYPINSVLRKVS